MLLLQLIMNFLKCVVSLLLLLSTSSGEDFKCSTDDSSLSRSPTRSCRIRAEGPVWATGCGDNEEDYSHAAECQAFLRMKLNVQCDTDPKEGKSHRIEIFKNKERKSASATLLIPTVQLSDGGEYECRTIFSNSTYTSTFFNVSIFTATAIGIPVNYCAVPYSYNDTYNCCLSQHGQDLSAELHKLGYFYAYGSDNVSVKQQWLTPASEHYHTDVGLTISDFNSSLRNFSISVEDFPEFLSSKKLSILAIVTVTNSLSGSFSVCTPLFLKPGDDPRIGVNQTLPESATTEEGGIAVFECEFYSATDNCDNIHYLRYFHDNSTDPVVAHYSRPCSITKDSSYTNGSYTLNISFLHFQYGLSQNIYRYSFYIYATREDNNSMVSCAIKRGNQYQWERNATLLVYPGPIDTAVIRNTKIQKPLITIVIVILSTVVFAAAVVSCLVVFFRQRRKKEYDPLQDERDSIGVSDSQCVTSLSEGKHFPTHQITNDHEKMGLTVMEACEEIVQDYDGRHQSSSLEDCKNTVYKDSIQPSSLTHLKQRNCNLNYTDPSVSKYFQENPMIYISYTENKADWVYDYLKPLLESWNTQTILHDEDMIPGFTVSGERQRLIFQAHRVVLVISPDYSDSPWCLYDLQHAITKEPVLFRGRILPILVDGCDTLPVLVKGIVPLFDFDVNFELKLKMNICGTT